MPSADLIGVLKMNYLFEVENVMKCKYMKYKLLIDNSPDLNKICSRVAQ
jgi:hypothetical protein